MRKTLILMAAVLAMGAAAMAADVLVPNRLATAKVGEWASYKVPNGYTQKLTVIKREGEGSSALVTVRVDNIYEGELVESTEFTRDAGEPMEPPRVPDEPGIEVEITTRTATIKGKSVSAVVVEIEYDDDYFDDDDIEDVEWWVSADIPVFGIIRQEVDDDVMFEIIDFGEE